jgi:hypothetical protein
MLAVDMIQSRRGMNEVKMNGVSESGRHLYALDWSCGAYVLPPNPSLAFATCRATFDLHARRAQPTAQQHSDYLPPRGRQSDEGIQVSPYYTNG